jgi:two-component sensor histidine kinase
MYNMWPITWFLQIPHQVTCQKRGTRDVIAIRLEIDYCFFYCLFYCGFCFVNSPTLHNIFKYKRVLLWAQLTKIYPPLSTSVQPISITKTLLIVPTKNERHHPLFTGKVLIKFQNILRSTTQVIIRHRVKILFSIISSPITLELQKCKSSKMKGILLSSPVSCW